MGRLCPGAPLVLAFLSSQNRSFSSALLEVSAAVLVAFSDAGRGQVQSLLFFLSPGVRQARRRPLLDCLTCTDYFLCLFLITLLTQLLKMLCPSFFLSLSLFNAVFLTCLSPFLFYFLPLQLTRSLCLTLVHDLKGDVCNV